MSETTNYDKTLESLCEIITYMTIELDDNDEMDPDGELREYLVYVLAFLIGENRKRK